MKRTVCSKTAVFSCGVGQVWSVVTCLENVAWRSDLEKVEILDDARFVEYAKGGYPTAFTVTLAQPCRRWEFDMENTNMQGHWTGVFTEKDGATEVSFTEEVAAKKWFMRPFVRRYLEKQQQRYIDDLQKALDFLGQKH